MNNIDSLREDLFSTIKALRDKDSPMDLDRAKAISDIAQVIINSAKVEVDYLKVTGDSGSGFIGKQPQLPPGITGNTVHKLRG